MSGRIGLRRTIAPLVVATPPKVATLADASRAIDELARDVTSSAAGTVYVADVDLVVGVNVIDHGLGRTPVMVHLAPADAAASFAWAWDPEQPGNPRPTAVMHLTVAGVPMTARVVVE